jgi:hypothetical protein
MNPPVRTPTTITPAPVDIDGYWLADMFAQPTTIAHGFVTGTLTLITMLCA